MDFWSGVDLLAASVYAAWTIAIVSGVRARVPAIDGGWVLLVSAGAASLVAAIACGPDWWMALRYAGLAWVGAIGGVSFMDRAAGKLVGHG